MPKCTVSDLSPADTKSHPGIYSPFIHSVVSNDFVHRQQKPWSECADAQADMGLHCAHMAKDMFSHGAALI